MFGDVTPNLSIRLRNTSKAETIDSSIFVSIIPLTSLSDISNLMTSLNVRFAKISGEANLVSPLIASNAVKKDCKYESCESFCNSSASSKALLKIGSLLLLAKPFKISLTEI